MKKQSNQPPAGINYQAQQAIEQMVSTLPKGTDLALCDVISAMYSGYFIESGGAITPAVDRYLAAHSFDENERNARTRRAAKAVTYGQYHLNEFIKKLSSIVETSGEFKPTIIQGYCLKPVDMTSFKRPKAETVKSKQYDSTANRAVAGVPYGIMGTTGMVSDQRVAILDMLICGNINQNEPSHEMERVYKKVAELLKMDEIALFDAGFSLIDAVIHGVTQCVVRLAKNCTVGRLPGEIPPQTSEKGRPPSRHQAEVVRPLARLHGKKLLEATAPDETMTWFDDDEKEIKIEIWCPVYFLERHLDRLNDEGQKGELRKKPLKVVAIHHPDFDDPLLLGTPIVELKPQSMAQIYPERWPIEGVPQTAKFLLSGGGGRHYVHHPRAVSRLPALSMIFGSLLKFLAASFPPIRSGFWDREVKPTYGRLLKQLKKVGLPLSEQLSKKASVTAHLPVGYEAIRLSKA